MKVSAINGFSTVSFNGEGSTKTNKVKNAAGAAMLALAAVVPAEEADAQLYRPLPPPPAYYHYYVPAPVMKVPRCFIYGDETNENYEKTMSTVFNEIDSEIEKNGQISVNEVVRLEEYNWNSTKPYLMSRREKLRTADLVKNLSKEYNQSGSDPNTINYQEYKNIMDDYMESKNIADFMNLIQILSAPRPRYYPYPRPFSPHHHRHY